MTGMGVLALVAVLAAGEPAPVAPPPDAADWAELPTPEALLKPIVDLPAHQNVLAGVTLQAIIACTIDADGRATDCRVQSETPAGCGMGDAALKIAPSLRFTRTTRSGKPSEGTQLRIPLRLMGLEGTGLKPLPGCEAPAPAL